MDDALEELQREKKVNKTRITIDMVAFILFGRWYLYIYVYILDFLERTIYGYISLIFSMEGYVERKRDNFAHSLNETYWYVNSKIGDIYGRTMEHLLILKCYISK